MRTREAGTPLVAADADGHRQGRSCHGKPRTHGYTCAFFGFTCYLFENNAKDQRRYYQSRDRRCQD